MVSGFNASGCAIDIREVRGLIKACVMVYDGGTGNKALDFGEMLSPSISKWLYETNNIQTFSEFSFKINQHIPKNMHDELLQTSPDRRIELRFTKLDVMAYPTNGPAKGCRLPLWGGATFHLPSAEWLKLHKVVVVTPQPAAIETGAGF